MRGNVAPMTRVIATMSLSLDGIGAGDNQTLDRPTYDVTAFTIALAGPSIMSFDTASGSVADDSAATPTTSRSGA